MWDAITKDYTYKSVFSQARLHCEFTSARCPEKEDIQAFLNDLRMKKAELVVVDVNISDDDYWNSIIQFLPRWLATFTSNQLTAARLTSHDVDPELLIIFICDKWDHTCPSRRNSLQYDADNALAFEIRGKEKGKERQKDKGKKRKRGPCWICGSDHFKKECPDKNRKDEKGRNGSNTKLLDNSANTVEKDDDYAFTVEETSDDKRSINVSECKEIPDKSWSEEEFEEEVENQSDVEELTAKEIVSNVKLMTT